MVLETCRWRVMPLGFGLSLRVTSFHFLFSAFNLKQRENKAQAQAQAQLASFFLLFFNFAPLPPPPKFLLVFCLEFGLDCLKTST